MDSEIKKIKINNHSVHLAGALHWLASENRTKAFCYFEWERKRAVNCRAIEHELVCLLNWNELNAMKMRIKYSQRAYSFPITGNNASMIVSPPNSIAHKSSNSLDCCFYFMSEFQTMFRRYLFFLFIFNKYKFNRWIGNFYISKSTKVWKCKQNIPKKT